MIELQIPVCAIDARHRMPVVVYSLKKALRPYTIDRAGLLAKCTPINGEMAKKLVDHGYKQLSNFKSWCPIEVSYMQVVYRFNILLQSLSFSSKLMNVQRPVLPKICTLKSQLFPVICRDYIYYLSSSSAREQFMTNPEKYLTQTPPKPQVPIRLVIVGPPKSGKSEGNCNIHSTLYFISSLMVHFICHEGNLTLLSVCMYMCMCVIPYPTSLKWYQINNH